MSLSKSVSRSFQLLSTLVGYSFPQSLLPLPEVVTPMKCGYLFHETQGVRSRAAAEKFGDAAAAEEFYLEPSQDDWLTPEGRKACDCLAGAYRSAYAAKAAPENVPPLHLTDPSTIYNGPSYADGN